MKTHFLTLLLLPLFMILSCGQKTVTQGEKEIKLHCSGPEFTSNNKYFRASATGKSMNVEIAKKKAMTNARSRLAAAVQVQIRTVTDNYVKSTEMSNVESAQSRFEELTRAVVDQTMSDVKVICEKTTIDPQKNYTFYVALEMSADALLAQANQKLSQDQELKVDYNYSKFKETFEKEMEKMGNQ